MFSSSSSNVVPFKFNFGGQHAAATDVDAVDEQTNQQTGTDHSVTVHQLTSTQQHTPNIQSFDTITIPHTTPTLTLQKIHISSTNNSISELTTKNDVVSGVYEGGFKLWECTVDLIQLLADVKSGIKQRSGKLPADTHVLHSLQQIVTDSPKLKVLELGCGHALPAIYCLNHLNAAHTVVQDMNAEVIDTCTIPNIVRNTSQQMVSDLADRVTCVSGSWQSEKMLSTLLQSVQSSVSSTPTFNLILTAETIYNLNTMPALLSLIINTLSDNGVCLVAAKRYYFGVGGSTTELLHQLKTKPQYQKMLRAEVLRVMDDGKSNVREIIAIVKR